MSEEEKWLFQYTLPCHRGDYKVFQAIKSSDRFKQLQNLDGQLSREIVRNYFLREHNLKARNQGNFLCMLIQYQIVDSTPYIRGRLTGESLELPKGLREITLKERDLKRAIEFGILEKDKKLKPRDVVFMHGWFIVDVEPSQTV